MDVMSAPTMAEIRAALEHILPWALHRAGVGCDVVAGKCQAPHLTESAAILVALGQAPALVNSDSATWFEHQAVRAALHEAHGRCRDGLFEHCYDSYHFPPIAFFEWWPPLTEPVGQYKAEIAKADHIPGEYVEGPITDANGDELERGEPDGGPGETP